MNAKSHTRNITPADVEASRRLKAIWDERAEALGLTQDRMAEILERSQGLVSQYLNGRLALNYRALLAFSEQLGCAPTDIRSDLPEQAHAPADDSHEWADITGYAQQAAAGDGMALEEYSETHRLKFKASSLRRKGLHSRKLSVFYARGDSMEPRIHDGDALLFDQSDIRPQDGAIFVVNYQGSYLVKRLHQYGNAWFMVSDNGSDPKWRKPVPIDFTDGFEIIGRVRWIGSWED